MRAVDRSGDSIAKALDIPTKFNGSSLTKPYNPTHNPESASMIFLAQAPSAISSSLTQHQVMWDVGKIILTAVTGVLIGFYLSRRRIYISLVSLKPSALTKIVGFSVMIPSGLLEKLRGFRWKAGMEREFQDTEDLSQIHQQYKGTKLFQKAAEAALKALDQAISSLEKKSKNNQELKDMLADILSYLVLGRHLMNMAKRRKIATEPVPSDVASTSFVIQLREEEIGAGMNGVFGRFLLGFDSFSLSLTYSDPIEREAMERLAFLLTSPKSQKILDSLRLLKEELLTDLNLAGNIVGELEQLMLPHSRWVVEAQITNHGQKPVILSRFGELHAKCGGRAYTPIKLTSFNDLPANDSGDDDLPESEKAIRSFGVRLDKSEEFCSENIFIKPSETTKVVFVSDSPIGDLTNGDELLDFWKKRRPTYKLSVTPIPRGCRVNKSISSVNVTF